MATIWEDDRSGTGRRLVPLVVVCLALGLAALVTLPGCGGCRKDPAKAKKELEKRLAEERAKKKKEKPKPDFEVSRLMTRPSEGRRAEESGDQPYRFGPPCKPGHWTSTTLAAKTNNFDFHGDLELVVTNARGDVIPLVAMPFELATTRQVALPKRQPKVFESALFVPPTRQQTCVTCRLNARKGGHRWRQGPDLLAQMPSYQYHFLVLARWPENYTYLKGLDSLTPPSDEFASDPTRPYYRVALIKADKPNRRPLLPSHGLLWTSIACVLWHDAEPDCLDPIQQDALLDWLHWGGQLIISGPDTLDGLRGSFLAPYLPATAAPGVRKLSEGDFEELHQWSTASGKSVRRLVPAKQWTGIELQKHPQAQFVPRSGDLLVERRVGRGRIVVSAFGLSGRTLRSWKGLDELFNAFLLRRPAREFIEGALGELEVRWADRRLHPFDAAYISNLRYFTRDTGVEIFPRESRKDGRRPDGPWVSGYGTDIRGSDLDSGERPPPGPGVAAWNDFNPVAYSARRTLQNAAQIKIPKRSFVVWVVAAYLLVLVPANWTVFRLINRVEWAWAMAPAIAVACTVVVVRMAQLDIGFARSRTEIAVVELQADYPRAHVTRYTALYTSLKTSYDFHFEDPGALVLPFPDVDRPGEEKKQDRQRLVYRRGKGASLLDYPVHSNTTRLLHSEHMLDLGGALSLVEASDGRFQVVNRTEFTLHDAGVVRKNKSGELETAWVGRLEPGANSGWLRTHRGSRFWQAQPAGSLWTATDPASGELNFQFFIAPDEDGEELHVKELRPGQVRLLAVLQGQIPGLVVKPAAPQTQSAALVVAHLKYGFDKDPQPDTNTKDKPKQRRGPSVYDGFQVSGGAVLGMMNDEL